jgi:hypothetical protein
MRPVSCRGEPEQQPEQQPDECGLAGAVGAEEAEGDAARHLEVAPSSAARVPKRLPRPIV